MNKNFLVQLEPLVEIENYAFLSLGRLALEKNFINYQQLWEVMFVQHEMRDEKVGDLLLESGHITPFQLEKLLKEQKQYLDNPVEKWPIIPDSVLKGIIYLQESKFINVTTKNVIDAKTKQREYENKGIAKSLEELLVEDYNLVTKGELQRLRSYIKTYFFTCSHCKRKFRLFNCEELETLFCPVCWDVKLEKQEAKPKKSRQDEMRERLEKRKSKKVRPVQEEAVKEDIVERKEEPPKKKKEFLKQKKKVDRRKPWLLEEHLQIRLQRFSTTEHVPKF